MKTRADALPRPRLSVAMIVRDEQDSLAESLASVAGLADEIVVLDTGSTDSTAELAVQFGAAVHRTAWDRDFSAARNHCLRHVSGKWVLWLDAGERLAPNAAAEVRAILDNSPATSVYSLWVEVPPRNEGASAEQIAQYRLMPSDAGLRFAGRVRETIEGSLQATGLSCTESSVRILRHPRQHDPQRLLIKAQRDLELATAEAETAGVWSPRLLLAAGQAHSLLGQQEQARERLRRAIEASTLGSPQRLEAYYALLTTFDDDPEMHASQLTACLDSLQDFPFDQQLLLALGNYMLVRERLDLAIRAFEAAVRFGRITPAVWHLCEVREIAAVCLSLALQARQRDSEARDVLETALSARPDSRRLLNQLEILRRKQDAPAATLPLPSRPAAKRPKFAASHG